MIAFIGNYAHEMALAFLALEIGGSAAALGSLSLSLAVPALLLSLHGGVISDRVDTRKVIARSRIILGISSVLLFFVMSNMELKLWMIYAFTLFNGCIIAYDSPAYMATLQRLVVRKDFKMAVVLQSTNFHLSRALGPAFGALVMTLFGLKYVFLFAGLAFFFIAYVVSHTKLKRKPNMGSAKNKRRFQGLSEIKDVFSYLFSRPGLRYKLLQLFLTITVLIPVVFVVFRSYLKFRFDLDGDDFGFLFSFPAAGSMAGAIIFIFARFKDPIRNLRFAVPLLILAVGLMPLVPNTAWAAALLVIVGLCQYFTVNSTTQSLHFQIDEAYRGRLGSIIALCFGAITPLVSYPMSLVADHYGYQTAIYYPLGVFAAGSFFLALMNDKLKFMRVPFRRDKDDIPETTSNPYQ